MPVLEDGERSQKLGLGPDYGFFASTPAASRMVKWLQLAVPTASCKHLGVIMGAL